MPAPNTCTVSGTVYGPGAVALSGVKVKVYVTTAFTDGFGNYIPAGVLASATTDSNGAWSLAVIQTETLAHSVTFQFEYPLSNNQSYSVKYAVVVPDQATANFSDLVDLSTGSAIIAAIPTTDQLAEGVVNLYFTAARALAALPTTTKGDLIVRDSTANVRLAVGANNEVLTADSSTATGVKWAAAGAAGITDLTGDVSATGPGSAVASISDATVTGKLITGFVSGAGTVSATDTILQAINKLDGNIGVSNGITDLTGDVTATGPGSTVASISDATVTGKLITGFVSGAGTVAATDTLLQAVNKLDGNIAGKQASGNYLTDLTGDVTASGPGSASASIPDTVVTGKALTGFVSGAGSVSATDTILTAVNKLDGNIAGKQPTGNYVTSLTGDVTASGPGAASATIADATVTGKLITGFVSGAGTVAATDTILQAINKLDGNITASSGITALTGDVTATGPGSASATISDATVTGKLITGFVSGAGTVAATDSILQAVNKLDGNIAGKQPTGNYVTSLTGDVTASGPGAASATIADTVVTGKVLTGFVSGAGSVSAADTILTAVNKLDGNIAGKQAVGNYMTALTGDVTASGPGSASASISDATVTGKLITGFVSGAGTVAATDTILQAINKLDGNIGAATGITALTGDVTATGPGSASATVADTTVTGKLITGFVSGAGTVAATDTILQAVNKLDGNIAGKQATGNYVTSLTGDVTASGPGAASATISDSTVTGKLITGFSSGAGTVAATDSILQAINKLDGNIAGKQATGNYLTALTGDVTASGPGSGSATIANNAVTYAKIQNITATSRLLGRKTGGAGVTEECTLSEVLDFVGSAAQGDILYRGASSWTRLAAGTSGQFLKTQGAGANPVWDTAGSSSTQSWQGWFDSAAAFSNTSASIADLVAGGVSLTETDNNGFPTVSAATGSVAGVEFTPTKTGRLFVSFNFTGGNLGTGADVQFQLTDGSGTIIDFRNMVVVGGTFTCGYSLQGIYNISSLALTTFKLQGKRGGSGTVGLSAVSPRQLTISMYYIS